MDEKRNKEENEKKKEEEEEKNDKKEDEDDDHILRIPLLARMYREEDNVWGGGLILSPISARPELSTKNREYSGGSLRNGKNPLWIIREQWRINQ